MRREDRDECSASAEAEGGQLRKRGEGSIVACCRYWHRVGGGKGIAANVGRFVELDP